jgi:hypothetical protein
MANDDVNIDELQRPVIEGLSRRLVMFLEMVIYGIEGLGGRRAVDAYVGAEHFGLRRRYVRALSVDPAWVAAYKAERDYAKVTGELNERSPTMADLAKEVDPVTGRLSRRRQTPLNLEEWLAKVEAAKAEGKASRKRAAVHLRRHRQSAAAEAELRGVAKNRGLQ